MPCEFVFAVVVPSESEGGYPRGMRLDRLFGLAFKRLTSLDMIMKGHEGGHPRERYCEPLILPWARSSIR